MKKILLLAALSASLRAQTCTRDALKAVAANYFRAVETHSMSVLPTVGNVRITENAAEIKPGEGFFKAGGKTQFQRTIVDTLRCSTLTQAVVEEPGKTPVLMAVRLRSEAGKVSEIETVIARTGDFAFKPQGVLDTKDQDWTTLLPAAARKTREYMNAEAEKYYVMFEDHAVVPAFAVPCNRWENGTLTTPKGDCSWSAQVMNHPRRRFPVTDVELGVAGVITNFRDDWLDVHIFKFNKDGKIDLIQAVDGPGTKGTGWAYEAPPLVANVGNFIHPVANLDRSVRFYRDTLGMDMPRPAGAAQTTEAVLKMYDASGAKVIVANAQIPGSPMRVELVEFQGIELTPVQHRWGDAGTSVLMLTVTDLAPVAARLKAAGTPVPVPAKKACDGRGLVAMDPDGFAVMVVERGTAAADAKSNFTGMRFGYLVSGDSMARGPFAALGLKAATPRNTCRSIEDTLFNGAASIVTLPGAFEVWLVKGRSAAKRAPVRQRDPGAAVLRLMVTDVDAAVQALNSANVKVVSEGGVVQTLPPGTTRAGILGAPDDLFIQVVK